jgi:hypothetical protein
MNVEIIYVNLGEFAPITRVSNSVSGTQYRAGLTYSSLLVTVPPVLARPSSY